jgi:hypothetical protein
VTAAKKAAPSDDTVTVVMVGNSRGAKHGDERTVDQETADRLVSAGLARLP